MKKNISINIGNIIFHIEEDGYEKLKNYLQSINRYFSSYEDKTEIVADIENRIAEIFLGKLKGDKQVITMADVDDLISTMGTIADFEAAEEKIGEETTENSYSSKAEESKSNRFNLDKDEPAQKEKPRKLFRDVNRKLISGVAAGIAHYFGIDPLWIRVLFLLTFFDVFFFGSFTAFAFLSYIVLWIVVPPSTELEEDKKIKRLYRNPENRVLGGVGSGIAAYFGADETVIRLLFVVFTVFGGVGLLIYLILWFITPEAKTITDKMQMQGEPITLANIENNVRKNFNLKEGEEENLATKVLLFPFRVIATIINGLSKMLSPIAGFMVDIIRVGVGLFLMFKSLVILFALLVGGGIFAGFVSESTPWVELGGFPTELIRTAVPMWGVFFTLLFVAIPAIGFGLLGLAMIIKRKVLPAFAGWTLFGIWLVSIAGMAATIPFAIKDFKTKSSYKEETKIALADSTTLFLDLKQPYSEEDEYKNVRLIIRGYAEKEVTLEKKFSARGSNDETSVQNAKMVSYNVQQEGNKLIFDQKLTFAKDAKFRGQELEMMLFVPYGKEFIMNEELYLILRNTLHPYGYERRHLGKNIRWKYEAKGLICINCTEKPDTDEGERGPSQQGFGQKYDFKNFDEIEVGGAFKLYLKQGSEYSVSVEGDDNVEDVVRIKQSGNRLKIGMKEVNFRFGDNDFDDIIIYITVPDLKKLQLAGAIDVDIERLKTNDLEIELAGASKCNAAIDADDLTIKLAGAAELELQGKGRRLFLDLAGATNVEAYEYIAEEVDVDAAGVSNAKVHATRKLTTKTTMGCEVEYKGNPEKIEKNSNTDINIDID